MLKTVDHNLVTKENMFDNRISCHLGSRRILNADMKWSYLSLYRKELFSLGQLQARVDLNYNHTDS